MKSQRLVALLIMILFCGIAAGSPQHPEESIDDPEAGLPPPFETAVTVLSSTPEQTILEIIIDPTDLQRLSTPREAGLGLVAVANTGRIHVSVIAVDAAPLSNLDTMRPISLDDVPLTFARVDPPGIWRDIRVAAVYATPFLLTGDGGFVARRAILSVENGGGIGINEKTRPVQSVSPLWDRMYRRHVLNYDTLNLPRLEWGSGDRYIVISRTLFNDQTPQFVEWKTQQGYGTVVVTLDDIDACANPTNGPCITATRDSILAAYNSWPETPEFVILCGDMYSGNYDGSIWTDEFFNYFYYQGYRPYDQYYGFLEGNDQFADIMVGRVPDSNAERLGYFLAKTIEYEKEPNISGTWQENALMTLRTYHYDPSVNQHISDAKNSVSNQLAGWGMNVTERFQSQATPSQIIPMVNQGLSFYNYRGHECSGTDWNGTFTAYDVQYLSNVRKLGIWTVLSCSSASFDGSTTTAERLLRHDWSTSTPGDPAGAVGFIGSQAYTSYLFNDPLDEGFYLAWTDSGTTLLGEAFLSAEIYAWYNSPGLTSSKRQCGMKEYTILGDPSLQVWTDVPTDLAVTAVPGSVPVGQTTDIEITVERPPFGWLANALVCLWKGDDVYVYGYTGTTGSVTLPVTPATSGDIQLTVTAYNSIPWFETIPVLSGPLPPKSPENVTAELSPTPNDVHLTWSPVTHDIAGTLILIDHYEVYRKANAYFTIDESLPPFESTASTEYTDIGAAGHAGVNYFYRIVAVSSNDLDSEPSLPVGEFDYQVEQ